MTEIIYVIMEKDGNTYIESINETHVYYATSFRDAMFFENKLKAQKFIRDKELKDVEVCAVEIVPYSIN
jgi:hypothetical protein